MSWEYIHKIIYIIFIIYYFNEFHKNIAKEENVINKGNNANITQNFNNLTNLKKVIYTVLLGKYDNVKPINKAKGYDYFLFTDLNIGNKTNLNWTIVNINEKLNFSNKREILKKQRFFKINPHLFFKNYDVSIYFDTSYEIIGNINEFLLRILTPNISIYILEHPDGNSIDNEFKRVLFYKKETLKNIIAIQNRYKKEEFPDNNGLSENCLIVRKHNDLKCINFMNQWFNEIIHNSHRDQLSFNYILWKNGNNYIKYISKEFISKYFKKQQNHLKHIIFTN